MSTPQAATASRRPTYSVRDLAKCKHCGDTIVWRQSPTTKKWAPLDPIGTDHRERCTASSTAAKAAAKDRNHEARVAGFLPPAAPSRELPKRRRANSKPKAVMAALVAEARSRPVQLRNEALPVDELPPPWEAT
jgi:hypothetical protein